MVNTDPKRFNTEGYCLFPNVLSLEETTALRCMLDEALTTSLPLPTAWHQERADTLDRPDYLAEPHSRDVRWLELCRHPRILRAVEAILGSNIILVYSSMFIKLPNNPVAVAWHQDNNYWPSVHGTDVVTLWLACDNADAENCAMQVIPGSHRTYEDFATVPTEKNEMLSKKVEITPQMEDSAVTLAMAAGSLSIHDSYILHGSQANRSGRRRAGYTIRYCSTDTAWVDVEAHPIPVYLVHGEAGTRGQGYVDLRPGVALASEIFG